MACQLPASNRISSNLAADAASPDVAQCRWMTLGVAPIIGHTFGPVSAGSQTGSQPISGKPRPDAAPTGGPQFTAGRCTPVPRPTFAGFECRRRAAVDLELEEDGREMIPDGLVGDAQMARDRTIRRTLRQIEDVARRTLKTAAQPTVKAINPRSRNIEARQPCPGWFRGRGGRHAGVVASGDLGGELRQEAGYVCSGTAIQRGDRS